MSTKLGLVDMYIPARVYDSCMAWLRTVCHVSAFACTFLGLISTISFLFGICGIWHLRHRRQRKCRRLQRACRNSFYRSGFLFVALKIFEESAFFSRCVWWSFPPFFTNHFCAQCTPAFSVVWVLYLLSGAHSYVFSACWFDTLFRLRPNLCRVCYVLLCTLTWCMYKHMYTHTHNPPLSSGYAVHHSGMGCTGNGIRCPPCTDGGATGPGL